MWGELLPDTPLLWNWHLDLICRNLEAISRGEYLARGLENRLLANVPPGSAKSLVVAVFWPAWEWGPGGLPHLQILATSYREDFCRRDSERFGKLVASAKYQRLWPEVRLIKRNESRVENSRGGFRNTIPFRSLTGGRADRLLIDDPHSLDTAESDVEREKAAIRFRESASLRLNDPIRSAIVVIMQRLHQADISGVILDGKLPYQHIMLPMRFEPERRCVTPFGEDPRTKEGELLFPARFPRSVVDRDEATMGSIAVAAQHQQRPTPRGGIMFKRAWFEIVPAAPANLRWVRGWDLAASVEKGAAWTAGVKLGRDRRTGIFYVGDVARDRTETPELMLKRIAQQDGPDVEIDFPQDPGQAGKIQRKAIGALLAGFRFWSSPEGAEGKEARAEPVAAQAEVGNVRIVEGPWNDAFLAELELFPRGAYKDQVDALSRAFGRHVLSAAGPTVSPTVVMTPRTAFGDYGGM